MQNDYERIAGLYRMYEQAMFRVARAILHDDYFAEDAVQEAFIRLIRARDKLGDISSPKTRAYVMQTAKSCAVDIYRKRARESERVTELTDALADSLTDDKSGMSAADVAEAVDTLADKYARVIRYRFILGLSVEETAAVMKVSTDCVRKRTERAKKMLEKKFGL